MAASSELPLEVLLSGSSVPNSPDPETALGSGCELGGGSVASEGRGPAPSTRPEGRAASVEKACGACGARSAPAATSARRPWLGRGAPSSREAQLRANRAASACLEALTWVHRARASRRVYVSRSLSHISHTQSCRLPRSPRSRNETGVEIGPGRYSHSSTLGMQVSREMTRRIRILSLNR